MKVGRIEGGMVLSGLVRLNSGGVSPSKKPRGYAGLTGGKRRRAPIKWATDGQWDRKLKSTKHSAE
jgi:hypothetical protein